MTHRGKREALRYVRLVLKWSIANTAKPGWRKALLAFYKPGKARQFIRTIFSLGCKNPTCVSEVALSEIALGEIALGETVLGEVVLGEVVLHYQWSFAPTKRAIGAHYNLASFVSLVLSSAALHISQTPSLVEEQGAKWFRTLTLSGLCVCVWLASRGRRFQLLFRSWLGLHVSSPAWFCRIQHSASCSACI